MGHALSYIFCLQYLISSMQLPSGVGVIIVISIMGKMKLGDHLTCPKLYVTRQWQAQDMNLGLRPKPGLFIALGHILESQGSQKRCKQYVVGVCVQWTGGVSDRRYDKKQSHLLGGGYTREDYMTAKSCLD